MSGCHRQMMPPEKRLFVSVETVIIISLMAQGAALFGQAPQVAANAGGKSMERITVSVEAKILNPVCEKNAAGQLTRTAFYSDGSQPPSLLRRR